MIESFFQIVDPEKDRHSSMIDEMSGGHPVVMVIALDTTDDGHIADVELRMGRCPSPQHVADVLHAGLRAVEKAFPDQKAFDFVDSPAPAPGETVPGTQALAELLRKRWAETTEQVWDQRPAAVRTLPDELQTAWLNYTMQLLARDVPG